MKWLTAMALIAGIALLGGCETDPQIVNNNGGGELNLNEPDGSYIPGGFFTDPPGLRLVSGDASSPGSLRLSITAARPANPATDYFLYMIPGSALRRDEILSGDSSPEQRPVLPIATITRDSGEVYSAVLVAVNGEYLAYSAVQQAVSSAQLEYALPADETGVFRSWRLDNGAPAGTTYYIDFNRGNDSNSGTSPLEAWRTFRMTNDPAVAPVFEPGDQILLEADSIWNGTSVTAQNWHSMGVIRHNGGMLSPRGSGAPGAPIVIDLYRMVRDGGALKVYYSANQRPIINGNGTPSPGLYAYYPSGAITLNSQPYFEIHNMEVTNSFDFPNIIRDDGTIDRDLQRDHWISNTVPKSMCGISIYGHGNPLEHIVIRNNYVHDVQSEGPASPVTNTFGPGDHFRRTKMSGGITILDTSIDYNGQVHSTSNFTWSNVLVEQNIIRRVNMLGFRNGGMVPGTRVRFIGNYLDGAGGDGFVLTRCQGTGENQSRAEHNIIKNACANPHNGTRNYASSWTIYGVDVLLQFNEVYGTLYGYQDGEAFDIDGGCNRAIYQYNYSHHNAGGAILFMGTANNVFRYNISANDGISTRGMATLVDLNNPDALRVSQNASFNQWQNGQIVFHFASGTSPTGNQNNPLIYNNTIFTGNGFTVGLLGGNSSGARSHYARFYNNIVLKEGSGLVHINYGTSGAGNGNGSIHNPAGVKNNIFFAYTSANPHTYVPNVILHAGQDVATLTNFTANGNKTSSPRLRIQESGSTALLRAQRDTEIPQAAIDNPALMDPSNPLAFTSRERLRTRASIFSPTDTTSIAGGMDIPSTTGTHSAIDGAWNNDAAPNDFFGRPVVAGAWPIGAANGPFTPDGTHQIAE